MYEEQKQKSAVGRIPTAAVAPAGIDWAQSHNFVKFKTETLVI